MLATTLVYLSEAQPDTKKVFAHYMILYYGYQPHPVTFEQRVAAYKKEIQDAQAIGIDGFVINVGKWDAFYQLCTAAMYQAAAEGSPAFTIFFSIDFNNGTPFDKGGIPVMDTIRQIIKQYYNHPNQFRYGGKPVVSTFFGSQKSSSFWQVEFLNPLAAEGYPVLFIPNFYRYNHVLDLPAQLSYIQGIYDDYPFVDGLFYFGAAGIPPEIVVANRFHQTVAVQKGKLYMATVSPTYSDTRTRHNNRIFNYRGGEGIHEIWQGILQDQPQWVQVVTWNDFVEQHYIGSSLSNIEDAGNFPHVAYRELCRYYIQWYKTGSAPLITTDRVMLLYRTHAKDIVIPGDPLGPPLNWETVSDHLYATAFLTQPAELILKTGSHQSSFHLPAGMQFVSIPFEQGTQAFTLRRGQNTVMQETGAKAISNAISAYNFNYYTLVAETETVTALEDEISGGYSLAQNYPNPFTVSTTIPFTLPHPSFVSLIIVDNTGKPVSTLINKHLPAGTHEISLSAELLAAGMYGYFFRAGAFTAMKKFILIR